MVDRKGLCAVSLLILQIFALFPNACECVSVYTGPSDTTREMGSTFKLKCVVNGKDSVDNVIWHLVTKDTAKPTLLAIDAISKNPDWYDIDTDHSSIYNLIIKNATSHDDGTFQCEAGTTKKSARVYIYDKPDSITLDWEHSVNKPGAVEAHREYKLKCTTKNSYPPATHRYYKDGVELSNTLLSYTYSNKTGTGYGDVISTLPFKPTEEDTTTNSKVKCVADLYNYRSVMSTSFNINSSTRMSPFGMGVLLVMIIFLKL